ncbi:hypothetical protein Tco_0355055 [Tanacetum coccineum]
MHEKRSKETKDFSFGDQFFNDKPSEADNEKTTTNTEAESMVSITIHQDTSAIPPMTSPVIDLVSRPDSPNVHQPLPTTTTATATTTTTIMTTIPLPPQPQQGSSDSILINRLGELEQHIADLVDANQALEERLDKHGSRLYRLENQDIPNQVSKAVDEIVTDAVDWAMQAPLRERFRDLPEADMKEILHNRMWESKSYQTHEDHMTLYEALEKSMARDNSDQLLSDLAEARKKKKKRQGSPKTPPGSPPHPPPPAGPSGTSGASGASGSSQSPPPPPPPSNNQGGQSTSTAAPSSSKTAASAEYTAWTMTDTRLKPSVSPIPEELHMDDDTTADEQAYSSSGEDVGRDHIPTVNLRQSWWKPITEDRPATPEPAWSIPSSDLTVPTNNWASALKSTYTPPPENSLLAQIGDMATFMDWYCKKQGISELTQKDLEGPAYEIVKVFHPDVVHLQFQMEECHKLLTDQVDDAILRYNVSKPLPLGGDPGHVTIQPDFFFNKDLEYLRYGRKICSTESLICSLQTLDLDFSLFKLALCFLGWAYTFFFLLLLSGCEILSVFVLPEGFDLLALVEVIIPLEDDNGGLNTRLEEELISTEVQMYNSITNWSQINPLALVANHQQSSSQINNHQSSYNNPLFQQQYSPPQSHYGAVHPSHHYLTTYPSAPLAITYPPSQYQNAYSSTVHQEAYSQPPSVPQIEYTISTADTFG